MPVTAASFLADKRMKEFIAVDPATVQAWLDGVLTELSADAWGSKFDEGHTFLTAHRMVRGGVLAGGAASKQPSGPLSSVSVGPVSKSWAAAPLAAGDDDFNLTPYGMIFKSKARALFKTPIVI